LRFDRGWPVQANGVVSMKNLLALRGLLPSLSGLIRDHAAFFVDNPTLPLT
jgi:hypothetical protein